MNNNLSEILKGALVCIKGTGKFIAEQQETFKPDMVEVKGRHDFVSYVDKTAEKMLIEGLSALLPESGFLAEESTVAFEKQDWFWIIDPLDGTTNFVHGLAPYAISVALVNKNKTVMGVVYEITHDECFYAIENEPAYLNEKIIRVSDKKILSDSLIATGFPYYDYERMEPFMKTLAHFFNHTHGVRRLGSAATDLAYVACGRFEAFYEYSLHPWDVAAGAFIVQQAGGKVSDFSGGDNFVYGKELISTNSEIFDEFLSIVKEHLVNT